MAKRGGKAAAKPKAAAAAARPFDWKNPDYEAVFRRREKWLENLRKSDAAGEDPWTGLKERYRDSPTEFITDWGMTFDPRNAEIKKPTWIPFVLFPKQEELVDWLLAKWLGRKDGLVEKSRDAGITWLCVGFAVWMWIFHSGSVVGFGSRKEEYVDQKGDPKSIFWKVRAFIAGLPKELRPAGYVEARHAPFMRVINPENGAVILGEAGDNIGRGNRTSIYFKDESAHYEHPEAIDAALSMTCNCQIDVSTPNGAGNPFYVKRHSGRVDVFRLHWRDDPRKDEAWYEDQKRRRDPVIVAQEIDINYEASTGDAFIPGELVTAAQAIGPADIAVTGDPPVQFGLDVARFGKNKSVLTARRGRAVLWQKKWQGIGTMDLATHVRNEVKAFGPGVVQQIAVDVIGVGAGVADRLRDFFPAQGNVPSIVVDVNCALRVDDGVNYNLKAQMWENGREWLEHGPVSLPNDPDLKSQLCSVKYRFRGGLRLIEDKEELMARGIASPDQADSFMLTFAVPLGRHNKKRPTTPAFQPQNAELGMLG